MEEDENGVMREVRTIIEIPGTPDMTDSGLLLGETVKGVYVLHGREVRFRELDPRDRIAEFDGYALYNAPAQRAEGSTTTLQTDEDIIIAGRNLYSGRIIN
jgi:hypothetical protein